MTFRTSINSKQDPKDVIRRGFKSMFGNYEKKTMSEQPSELEKEKEEASGQ